MLGILRLPCLFTALALVFAIIGDTCHGLLCPHQSFAQRHVCDECHNEVEFVQHLKSTGVSEIRTMFGPAPPASHPPDFRPTGPYNSDPCVNSQARPAYRCNMRFRRPYCFKIGSFCYGLHNANNGELDSEFVWCVDNYAWERQHQMDDYNTDRQSDPEIQ